jgi:hypothetical protein
METENPITPVRPRAATRKRDQKIRRLVRHFQNLSNLADLRYRPALQTAARLTLLVDRAYELLKDRKSLLDEDGELSSSLDTFRRLCDSQLAALKSLGLSPTSVIPEHAADKSLDAVYQRIAATKRTRDKDPDEPAASPR